MRGCRWGSCMGWSLATSPSSACSFPRLSLNTPVLGLFMQGSGMEVPGPARSATQRRPGGGLQEKGPGPDLHTGCSGTQVKGTRQTSQGRTNINYDWHLHACIYPVTPLSAALCLLLTAAAVSRDGRLRGHTGTAVAQERTLRLREPRGWTRVTPLGVAEPGVSALVLMAAQVHGMLDCS